MVVASVKKFIICNVLSYMYILYIFVFANNEIELTQPDYSTCICDRLRMTFTVVHSVSSYVPRP